jgi:hypothetical protein
LDLGPLARDLHLLYDHHQEESEDGDDEQKRPESEAKPWSSLIVHHVGRSISGTGHWLNAVRVRHRQTHSSGKAR